MCVIPLGCAPNLGHCFTVLTFSTCFKARHAENAGAAAIGLMPTTYFIPKSVGVYWIFNHSY